MSIDDLKSLMDDFEPATLLPELENLSETLAGLMRFAVIKRAKSLIPDIVKTD